MKSGTQVLARAANSAARGLEEGGEVGAYFAQIVGCDDAAEAARRHDQERADAVHEQEVRSVRHGASRRHRGRMAPRERQHRLFRLSVDEIAGANEADDLLAIEDGKVMHPSGLRLSEDLSDSRFGR
jgi:hypothetical protein